MPDVNAPIESQPNPGRLVVVSNRLPFALKKADDGTWSAQRSAGGLATAMDPLLKRSGGIWIGWSGDSSDPADPSRRQVLDDQAGQGFHALELSKELVAGFYEGFSNETLWPLFHQFPSRLEFDPAHWADYREANRVFCEAVLPHLQPDDLVWIHDYQLMLLPQMLREARPEARIGFFLHIPFPTSAMFRLLPRGDELLAGVLGADFIAFHTHSDVQHFRDSVLRRLGIASQMDQVEFDGRVIGLEALPISIDPKSFTDKLEKLRAEPGPDGKSRIEALRASYASRRLIVAVDRLDYTKGIPNRFRAFDRLFRDFPEFREKVVLIQVAVPSREGVQQYADLGQETNELVGQINGRWGTPEWTPLVYIRRGLPAAELAALYAAADVCWVAPLRDGMNLVAKEFVACKPDGDGVLVLSEFAGAAAELGEAIFINPYDEERTAESVARALTMPDDERRGRMMPMVQRVAKHDVFSWGERFIESLRAAADERSQRSATRPPELKVDDLLAAYRSTAGQRRLLLLDYDGTLAGFTNRPQDAAPSGALVDRIAALCADESNTVAIVSGRSGHDLDRWFAKVPGLWLAGEHGAMLRSPRGSKWESQRPITGEDWKPRVRAILDHFVDRTPGSFVEEKEFSLVWHYRRVHPEFGDWIANELAATLEPALADTELVAQRGNKIVEVKLTWANKGEVLVRLLQAAPDPAFLLFAGDDRTDEDLFVKLPETAWSILIGNRPSRARFRLPDPTRVQELLGRLAAPQT
jgi:trehalose 6-phosphate synthase/phosphatase